MILDGGMGRELHRRGAPFRQPEWSALALSEAPEMVRETHLDFIRAGAQVITANAYAVVPFHIGEVRFAAEGVTLAATAGRLAREAVVQSGQEVLVAASLPPLFGSYRADLFDVSRVEEIARPLIDGQSPFADVWLCETQSSIAEVRAVRALLATDKRPFWVSFTLQDEGDCSVPRLRSGELVSEAIAAVAEMNVAAVLFNCSRPEVMLDAVKVAAGHVPHLGVYANAFEENDNASAMAANDGLSGIRADNTPERYVQWAREWCAAGADMVGGCCGISPAHIAALARALR